MGFAPLWESVRNYARRHLVFAPGENERMTNNPAMSQAMGIILLIGALLMVLSLAMLAIVTRGFI